MDVYNNHYGYLNDDTYMVHQDHDQSAITQASLAPEMNLADDLDESVGWTLLGGNCTRSSKACSDCSSKGGRPTNAACEELWRAWEESHTRILEVGYGLGWTIMRRF
jgi:hypothetical protein